MKKVGFIIAYLRNITYFCHTFVCGSSSVGRALASQAKGHGFESRLPLFLEIRGLRNVSF